MLSYNMPLSAHCRCFVLLLFYSEEPVFDLDPQQLELDVHSYTSNH